MLTARGSKRIGRGQLRWTLAFARRLWCLGVERSELVLDTRFIPATAESRPHAACLYLLARGTFETHGASALRFEGPCAFVLSGAHFDGAAGARPFTFRSWGDPLLAIEVHLRLADIVTPPAAVPVPVVLDDETWELARAAMRVASDDDTHRRHISALLDRLASLGVIAPAAAQDASLEPPRAFALLWGALRPMIERLYLTPTLQEVGEATGVSVRQVDRYIQAFVTRFALVGDGWRPTTRHLRLKLAILLSSAPDASIADVARAVGYGSPDAMARAYRDAGLPSPRTVQEHVREGTLLSEPDAPPRTTSVIT